MKRAIRWSLFVTGICFLISAAPRRPLASVPPDREARAVRMRVLDAIETTVGEIQRARKP